MESYKGVEGPWMIIESEEWDDISIVEECGYSPGFYTEICKVRQGMNEANLIASAPELLEALKNIVHLHSCEQEGLSEGKPTPEQWLEAVKNAQQAINKALNQ